jgi:hypothetical protein
MALLYGFNDFRVVLLPLLGALLKGQSQLGGVGPTVRRIQPGEMRDFFRVLVKPFATHEMELFGTF